MSSIETGGVHVSNFQNTNGEEWNGHTTGSTQSAMMGTLNRTDNVYWWDGK